MKKLKMFVCVAMAMTMLWHGTSTVYAVTHAVGCGTTSYLVRCGSRVASPSLGSHYVYDKNCHGLIFCAKTGEIHLHTIVCSEETCRGVYATNVARNCIEKHSYCSAVEYVCQY